MTKRSSPAGPEHPGGDLEPGSVRVTVADSERRGLSRGVRIGVIALAAVLSSAGVLIGARLVGGAQAQSRAPDADRVTRQTGSSADEGGPVPGSTRLALLGPLVLLDSRGTGAFRPGAEVSLSLPVLPPGTTAVALEVSLLEAAGPGAVTVGSDAGQVTVLRVARAKAMSTATAMIRVGPDDQLRIQTDGGGHLLVNLVGALEPVDASRSGRIVPVPATQVLRLVPKREGNDAIIDPASVPALREAGSVSAVLLQFAADVGRNGGSVAVGTSANRLDQHVFWSATTGDDRTRSGFLVVPLLDGSVHVTYHAGSLLTVDLVGYVTGADAPRSAAGLVVPTRPAAAQSAKVAAGATVDVTLLPLAAVNAVPADRMAGALVGVSAVGDAVGGVSVYAPDSPPPSTPILTAAAGAPRQALTLARAVGGVVRVGSASGASVSLLPQAFIVSG